MKTHAVLARHGLFDSRVPRYTSYPPANRFSEAVGKEEFGRWLGRVRPGEALSIYVHVPFCRRLCWFCACRTQGTRTDRPLARYVATLRQEIDLVRAHLPRDVGAIRLHLGGGTPTLLPPALSGELIEALRSAFPFVEEAEFSAEIDPTEFDADRAEALARLGLNRASIGVQDFEPSIQEQIGREQDFTITREAVEMLRGHGVGSINLDILYGLPDQTVETLDRTLDQVLALEPDRVAAFGYAHVPWMSPRQRLIREDRLPSARARLDLFEHLGRRLVEAGYVAIGIDHFARPGDSLAQALHERRLKRNFQGYTDDPAETLVALGASAISRFREGYAQNLTATGQYQKAIEGGALATARGAPLSPEERLTAAIIESLMCYGEADVAEIAQAAGAEAGDVVQRLAGLARRFPDVTEWSGSHLMVPEPFRPLLRIIAAAADVEAAQANRHSLAV